jgi:hypothetical protein
MRQAQEVSASKASAPPLHHERHLASAVATSHSSFTGYEAISCCRRQ